MKIPFVDSLVNLVSGLGTAKDKTTANQYGFVQLSTEQLESAYRGDWIAAKAVDIPAEEVYYTWKPLWQVTESEKADNALKKSQVIMNLANSMVLPQEVLSAGAMNMLIEDGTLPGLEAAIEEYEGASDSGDDIDEEDPEVMAQFEGGTE